jgi:hypothetical protein
MDKDYSTHLICWEDVSTGSTEITALSGNLPYPFLSDCGSLSGAFSFVRHNDIYHDSFDQYIKDHVSGVISPLIENCQV